MNDEIDILIAGNLRGAARLEQRGADVVATAQVCATVVSIRDGRVVRQSCCLAVELAGLHAHAFVRQHGAGSRVVLRRYLDERRTTRTERLPRADGPGMVAVTVERRAYVLMIERVLHSAAADEPAVAAESTSRSAEHESHAAAPVPADTPDWRF